jgi:CSLREA domain-containing protein
MKTGSFEMMRAYRVKVLVVVLGELFASLGLLASSPADAFPVLFIVNTTADSGDGNCTAHGCTLREAINEANDFSGKDAIHFNIPGVGVKTISPASPLPEITDEVTIDGYTQPGASPTP